MRLSLLIVGIGFWSATIFAISDVTWCVTRYGVMFEEIRFTPWRKFTAQDHLVLEKSKWPEAIKPILEFALEQRADENGKGWYAVDLHSEAFPLLRMLNEIPLSESERTAIEAKIGKNLDREMNRLIPYRVEVVDYSVANHRKRQKQLSDLDDERWRWTALVSAIRESSPERAARYRALGGTLYQQKSKNQ